MSQKILPQKRSATLESSRSDSPSPPDTYSQRYTRLLSVLSKSLQQSRDKVEADAPQFIKDVYGDMTSLFTTGEDNDGVTQLVNLLLGKLDSVHDRFSVEPSSSASNETQLEKLLRQHHILQLLQRVETAVDKVEKDEREFQQNEEADKKSAEHAIKKARTARHNVVEGKLRAITIDAQKFTDYHTYKMKEEYLDSLKKELEEVGEEIKEMDVALKARWEEWQKNLGDVKGALELLQQLSQAEEEEEGVSGRGGSSRDP